MSLFNIVAGMVVIIIAAVTINAFFNPGCCSQQRPANRRWLLAAGTALAAAFAVSHGV